MANNKITSGSCLCGSVKIKVQNISKSIGACHCSMCRKWTGGPLIAVDCGTDVEFEGEENVTRYSSSLWAERGFCSMCGSSLFYRLKSNNQYIMAFGIFDNMEDAVFDHQIFIEEKPESYSFSNKTKNMTGEEVFKQFAPSED